VFVADYRAQTVLAEIELLAGDEPGRVVEDAAGRVHVVLRSGGAVLTLAAGPWHVAARRPVCLAPRGIAFDRTADLLHVACAEGDLVSLPAAPEGAVVRRVALDRDLRDVVVDGKNLLVSRFRSAEVLTVDMNGDGHVVSRYTPPDRASMRLEVEPFDTSSGGHSSTSVRSVPATMTASVAWRLVGLRPGMALLLHQRGMAEEVAVTAPGGYSGTCGGVVETTVSEVGPLGEARVAASPPLGGVAVAVDVAVSPDGRWLAAAIPGNASTPGAPTVIAMPISQIEMAGSTCGGPKAGGGAGGTGGIAPPRSSGSSDGGAGDGGGSDARDDELPDPLALRDPAGQTTAVAYDRRGHVLVQTREPASIQVLTANRSVLLSADTRKDLGQQIFHADSGGGLACASCHPEGGDDGRIWRFKNDKGLVEARRTQSLRGGLLATAPFHWNGDLPTLGALMTEVFEQRMGGPKLTASQVDSLGKWIDTIPALPTLPVRDPDAVSRGRALFESASVGCTSCHNGPHLTNNNTVDVGTGRPMQVPSLRGVGWRAPFMHDGCATTLAGRFTAPCGGGDKHGLTSKLAPPQTADLAAYLETL
jgi:YD repeat-containing protein